MGPSTSKEEGTASHAQELLRNRNFTRSYTAVML